ncbi:MAG: hypothetical protein ABIF08_04545 [Nanoarchaeota archaeon]
MELPVQNLINKEEAEKIFEECCKQIGIDANRGDIKDLVIYELTDGTRTSTELSGWEAYFDGGLFVLRLIHILNHLGCKNFYVLTTGKSHRIRENYKEIITALTKEVDVYRKYAKENGVRLRFVGDLENIEFEGAKEFLDSLNILENETSENKGLTVHILIDYSSDWATNNKEFPGLPNANIIIKHTKGQINDGLWLPGKLKNNSFVYAQNASMSKTWSDKDITYLVAISLRSMILHQGLQYGKSYCGDEVEHIKKHREEELSMIHKKLEPEIKKRVVIFSHIGPEIYEF